MTYIDYDKIDEDMEKLHEYISEDLEVDTVKEEILLLDELKASLDRSLNQQPSSAKQEKETDYIG